MYKFLLKQIVPAIVFVSLVAGCVTPKMPDEVADQFWQATFTQDENKVKRYTTKQTQDAIDLSQPQWRDATVSFGEIKIKGDEASVETNIKINKDGKDHLVYLQTILQKEDGRWKVDYKKTQKTIIENDALAGVMEDVQGISKDFAQRLNDALYGLQKDMPKIQDEVKSWGDAIKKGLDDAKEQTLPQLEKNMDEFAKKLRKALEDAMKKEEKQQQEKKEVPPGVI